MFFSLKSWNDSFTSDFVRWWLWTRFYMTIEKQESHIKNSRVFLVWSTNSVQMFDISGKNHALFRFVDKTACAMLAADKYVFLEFFMIHHPERWRIRRIWGIRRLFGRFFLNFGWVFHQFMQHWKKSTNPKRITTINKFVSTPLKSTFNAHLSTYSPSLSTQNNTRWM